MKLTYMSLLWIGLAVALLCGLLWQFFPLPDAKARIEQLPLNEKNVTGVEIPLTVFEHSFFKNINTLKRIYNIDNEAVFIYVLDGTHNRHLVHDPLYCLRGAGWSVISQKPFKIEGGDAEVVKITKDGVKREALYWFSNGVVHYASPLHYWMDTTLRRLTLGASGAEPVLIVLQPVEKETLDWNKILEAFPALLKI